MPKARTVILNALGLHARPAMAFVELASTFGSDVKVRRADNEEEVDGKSIMQMLLLAATQGTEIEIDAPGADGDAALRALVKLVESKFDEE
ncbi:MAG: HPr family phosphocarrier protein [Phycisphaerales bacterium]